MHKRTVWLEDVCQIDGIGEKTINQTPWRRRVAGMKQTLLILAVVALVGCGKSKGQNEKWINAIIASGLSERTEVLQENDSYSDYKVYRDGNNDGVCYEYIFSERLSEDERRGFAGVIRGELVPVVRNLTLNDQNLKTAMENGVYLRFIFKNPDGGVVSDQMFSSSDL